MLNEPPKATKYRLLCGHSIWDWSYWYNRCLKCHPVKHSKP